MISLYPPPAASLGSDEDLEQWYGLPACRHLRANFMASLDGAVELDGRSGSLDGGADKRAFGALRSLADVVLVGSGTLRAEKYGPVRMDPRRKRERAARGQPAVPPLAIVSNRAALDRSLPVFAPSDLSERPIVLTSEAASREDRARLEGVAEVLVCGGEAVDPKVALDALARRGLERVLCEGGPTLLGALVRAGLVDELCLTTSPVLAGPGHLCLGSGMPPEPLRLQLLGLMEGDGLLLARYGITS